MIDQELENNLRFAADVQRKAGWSEEQIAKYSHQQRMGVLAFLRGVLSTGVELAGATHFDLPSPELEAKIAEAKGKIKAFDDSLEARSAAMKFKLDEIERILNEVYVDSGFRCLHEPLQEEIENYLNPRADQGDNHEQ